MAAGGQGQGDGGVSGAAGGDGGVPEGGRVGGAGGHKGQLTQGMKAHVYARGHRHMTRGESRGEKKGDDLASARDKALYAQHDAGAKDLERLILKRQDGLSTA